MQMLEETKGPTVFATAPKVTHSSILEVLGARLADYDLQEAASCNM